MIRRLKKDVLSELPPKKRQKVEISTDNKIIKQIKVLLNKATKKDLEEYDAMMKAMNPEGTNIKNDENINCYTKAYKLTGTAKIKGIKEYVEYLIDSIFYLSLF